LLASLAAAAACCCHCCQHGGRAYAGKAAILCRLSVRALELIHSAGISGIEGTTLVVGLGWGSSQHVIGVIVMVSLFLGWGTSIEV